MSFNKSRQRELHKWLQQQGILEQRWLRLVIFVGFLGGLLLVAQSWFLASILHSLIIDNADRQTLIPLFIFLIAAIVGRSLLVWLKEKISFIYGLRIRQRIRKTVLDRLEILGPAWIQGRPAGSWTTIILEQIENMQDYYSRYLPQMRLAGIIPLIVLAAVFPINWAAGVILLVTAPLIPLFMALVGMGAADANKRNFQALARLSGNFLDRLRGLETLRLFNQGKQETDRIYLASEDFRLRTMDVLKIAFLSSGVLEFFTSVSIAVVAVYFGFSYLGELNFGSYGTSVTLFAGFLVLILAPEFFQPLRDLGTFYHAKAEALGGAEALQTFLTTTADKITPHDHQTKLLPDGDITITITGEDLIILTPEHKVLAGPLNFKINAKDRIAIVGRSGSGKTSFINTLLGFLPYQGSLKINDIELRELQPTEWRKQINWVGQNPQLPEKTIRENILLSNPDGDKKQLEKVVKQAHIDEFVIKLPQGLDTEVGEDAAYLSVGQAQRIAVARALFNQAHLLLLDEPTASLDSNSEQLVKKVLSDTSYQQTTLLVTHQLNDIIDYDQVWVMDNGLLVQQGSYKQLSQQPGIFLDLLSIKTVG